MIKIKKNAAGLNRSMNKGQLLKDWVHKNTTYELVLANLRKKEGYAGPIFRAEVERFGAEMLAAVNGNANKQAVLSWMAERLGR